MANSQQTQAIARPARGLADMIVARKESFAAVLPKHITPDRFMKVAMAALTKTPKLLDCKPESVLMALVACSELGLEPNSPLGHAYLIPYGKDCQLVIGFKGLLAVARRSGEIGSLSVRVVYERDDFHVTYGDDEKIHHEPFVPTVTYDAKGVPNGFDGPKDAGNIVAAYMIARLKDGSVQREVMDISQILAIKARSRSGSNGPWVSDFAEMARKTVFRRGWKWLPQSTEMAKVAEYDHDAPEGIGANIAPLVAAAVQSRSDMLAAELEGHPSASNETVLEETQGRQPGED